MELAARIEQIEIDEKDVFHRHDPIKHAVFNHKDDIALASIMTPLCIINWFFPVRYFTSWYRMMVIIEVLLYLTGTFRNDVLSGSVWIVSVSVPISSTVIFIYASELRAIVTRRYGWNLYVYYHWVTHVIPSEIVFSATACPHPGLLLSTAVVIGYYIVYILLLYLIYDQSPLDNYYIADHKEQLPVLLLWCLSIVFSCALMEFLFVFAC